VDDLALRLQSRDYRRNYDTDGFYLFIFYSKPCNFWWFQIYFAVAVFVKKKLSVYLAYLMLQRWQHVVSAIGTAFLVY